MGFRSYSTSTKWYRPTSKSASKKAVHWGRYMYNREYREKYLRQANALAKATRAIRRHSRWRKWNNYARLQRNLRRNQARRRRR